jgi:hypothetical protein
LRPVEAELSPAYEIVEDDDELVREAWGSAPRGPEQHARGQLAGAVSPDRADEATRTDEGTDPILDALRAPLDRWMTTRLVRLFPIVVALYEKVKARSATNSRVCSSTSSSIEIIHGDATTELRASRASRTQGRRC